jgi:hypothetical protein
VKLWLRQQLPPADPRLLPASVVEEFRQLKRLFHRLNG